MKKFNELLRSKVGRKQPVVFAFGRLNPPTIGHQKLIERIITIAKRVKGLPVLYVSASQDKNKNPLTAKQKVDYLKKVYPRGIDIRTATGNERTFMEILKNRFDKKYTDVYMIAGSDRVAEFKRLIKKYNGTDYNFDTVNVVSAGERDPDATGATGMSASKMRGFASVNDFTSFKQGLISGTKEKDAMKLFKDLKKGMGVNEDMAPEDENLRTIRENYHNNDLFNMGDIIENNNNGNVGKIIKRGPNYVQYEMEDGGVEKAWLNEITPANNIDSELQVEDVDKKKLVLQTYYADGKVLYIDKGVNILGNKKELVFEPPKIEEYRHPNVGPADHVPGPATFKFNYQKPTPFDNVEIDCQIQNWKEVFLALTGHGMLCFFLGTLHHDSPGAYQFNQEFDMDSVDLHKVSPETAIENLYDIERRFKLKSIAEGKLLTCARTCGKKFQNKTVYVK